MVARSLAEMDIDEYKKKDRDADRVFPPVKDPAVTRERKSKSGGLSGKGLTGKIDPIYGVVLLVLVRNLSFYSFHTFSFFFNLFQSFSFFSIPFHSFLSVI